MSHRIALGFDVFAHEYIKCSCTLSLGLSMSQDVLCAGTSTAGGKADVQGHTCPSYIKMVIDKA